MTWLNGRKPQFMETDEKTALDSRQILHAAMSLSYEGLRIAAAAFIKLANMQGLSPAYISQIIEDSGENPVKETCNE